MTTFAETHNPITPAGRAELLRLENIAFAYDNGHKVLKNATLHLHEGEQLGLFGANGSGKTTLFRTIMGLHKAQSGRILLHGVEIVHDKDFCALRQEIGLVMQHAADQLFCPTVIEDVAFGPLNMGFPREAAKERALETLRELGIEPFAERLTHRLSGGEKKLVSLATVLAMRPKILLLDEPTTGLDPEACERICHVLTHLTTARIIISHDWDFLQHCSQKYITIIDGVLTSSAPAVLHTHTHAHIAGQVAHEH